MISLGTRVPATPEARRKRLRSKRIYAALIGAALLLLILAQGAVKEYRFQRRIGVSWEIDARGILLTQVDAGSPADRAGLKDGDRLLTVAGTAVRTEAEYDRMAAGFRRDRPVRFGYERRGAMREADVRPGLEFPWGEFLANVGVVLAYFGLGLVAYMQVFYDTRKRLLYLLAFAIAFEFALPADTLGTLAVDMASTVAFYLISGFEFGLELHLAACLPERFPWMERRRWLIPGFYVAGAAMGLWLSFAYAVDVLSLEILPETWRGSTAVLDTALLPAWAAGMLTLLLLQAARQKEALGRYQVYLVLLGILPWVLTVAYSTLVYWTDLPTPSWMTLAWSLALFPFALAIFVAMFRYQMFDIQLVVRKGMVYSALTGALLLLFYAVLGAGSFLISRLMLGGRPTIWVFSIAALLLGLAFQPLRQCVQSRIDRRFFPERHALRRRLDALAGELPGRGSVPKMGEHLVRQVREIFGLGSVRFWIVGGGREFCALVAEVPSPGPGTDPSLADTQDPALRSLLDSRHPVRADRLPAADSPFGRYLAEKGIELCVPLTSGAGPAGVLLLGGKASGQRYTREEEELLGFLAGHAALVFENARLFESATYDPLTGLPRREAVMERLAQEVRRALRYGRPLAAAMCDLDFFKNVNDRFGHLEGDRALKRVARAFAGGLRAADLAGRYGGDEFLMVLPETDTTSAREMAERVRNIIQTLPHRTDSGNAYAVTLSIGIATLEGGGTDWEARAEDLVGRADAALYKAKQAGRNSIVLYTSI